MKCKMRITHEIVTRMFQVPRNEIKCMRVWWTYPWRVNGKFIRVPRGTVEVWIPGRTSVRSVKDRNEALLILYREMRQQ